MSDMLMFIYGLPPICSRRSVVVAYTSDFLFGRRVNQEIYYGESFTQSGYRFVGYSVKLLVTN